VLAKEVQVIEEIEVYTQARQPKAKTPEEAPAPTVDVLHDERATPEERADFVRETLAPESEAAAPEELPPEGDKFEPESIAYEARKLARESKTSTAESPESKGLFSKGMSADVARQIDEKVSMITGEHTPSVEPASEDEHEHDEISTPDVPAGDVHVSSEEGEKEERKKGGPDPHAHPGKE
ncbi:MAG: hypothetical protein AABY13_00990, partial [Nanoarchaeota archaeon]